MLGDYWIDPNGGVPNDAVLARCLFESSATCILPNKPEVGFIDQTVLKK